MKAPPQPTNDASASGRARLRRLSVALIIICLGILVAVLTVPRAERSVTLVNPGTETAVSANVSSTSPAASPRNEAVGRRQLQPAQDVAQEQPTPAARQLVESLTRLEAPGGVLTAQDAGAWKQNLRQLVGQGSEAVPAIREFLLQNQNQDVDFTTIPGWESLGHASLRTALLNALAEIGGPEAQAVLAQTLKTTAVPAEIALIAKSLERQAPGVYRQGTLSAVKETLDLASTGKMAGWDVAPLFQVLQSYPGNDTVQALEQACSQWNYYATIALAGLPEGQGVAALIRQAQAAASSTSSQAEFGLEMLAQVATANPEAAAALVDLARQGGISDSTWTKLASGLSGDQYGMIQVTDGRMDIPNSLGTKVYYVAQGNQRFFSIPFRAIGAIEQMDQRRALIDQIIAATSNPAAVRALQDARNRLTGQLAGK